MSKIILLTGASSGIGKATAKQLILAGHTVYCAARRVEALAELETMGGRIIAMDITAESQILEAVSVVIQQSKRLDVLINNAGYAEFGSVEETPISTARRQFEVNLFGLAALTQAVLPYMREQKSGKIINISSVAGKMYTPLGAWYHASKHALEGWSDCLRLELKQFNIDVVLVEPGLIRTEFADVMLSPMNEKSGNGPYAELTRKINRATFNNYEKDVASEPKVIADLIHKIVQTKTPKTRYVKGYKAKPVLFARWLFSDRFFDRIILWQTK